MKRNLLIAMLIIFSISSSSSEDAFVSRIPNGSKNTCLNCHFTLAGGANNKNDFGTAFNNNGKKWSAALSKLDSDGDGVANGAELQDPTGVWKSGSAQPGNKALVTNPGDANDFPSSIEDFLKLGNISLTPNPANSYINFNVSNGMIGKLTVNIYDICGLLVNTFTNENSNGEYNFAWNLLSFNSSPVQSGYYFVEIIQNNYVEKRNFVVAR